jgi:hypothetical protein
MSIIAATKTCSVSAIMKRETYELLHQTMETGASSQESIHRASDFRNTGTVH